MGARGGLEERGGGIRVYCDSIALVPLWSCQELLVDLKSLHRQLDGLLLREETNVRKAVFFFSSSLLFFFYRRSNRRSIKEEAIFIFKRFSR